MVHPRLHARSRSGLTLVYCVLMNHEHRKCLGATSKSDISENTWRLGMVVVSKHAGQLPTHQELKDKVCIQCSHHRISPFLVI